MFENYKEKLDNFNKKIDDAMYDVMDKVKEQNDKYKIDEKAKCVGKSIQKGFKDVTDKVVVINDKVKLSNKLLAAETSIKDLDNNYDIKIKIDNGEAFIEMSDKHNSNKFTMTLSDNQVRTAIIRQILLENYDDSKGRFYFKTK